MKRYYVLFVLIIALVGSLVTFNYTQNYAFNFSAHTQYPLSSTESNVLRKQFEQLNPDKPIDVPKETTTPKEEKKETEDKEVPVVKSTEVAVVEPTRENTEGKPFVKLFIGITTSYGVAGKGQRDAVRKTWLNYKTVLKRNWTYKFFLGTPLPEHEQYKRDIVANESFYEDIVFLPEIDTYNNLSYKTMQLCQWAIDHYNFDHLMKVDDDVFVRFDRAAKLIEAFPKQKFYAGVSEPKFKPLRTGKWALTPEEYPRKDGPKWVHGFLYFLSYDLVIEIAKRNGNPAWPKIKLEDINTALIFEEVGGINPTRLNQISTGCVCKKDNNLIAFHYCNRTMFRDYYWKMEDKMCG